MNLVNQNIQLWGNNIPWLESLREKGKIAFERIGFPNNKNEAWKYSFIKPEILSNFIINNGSTDENECCCSACQNSLPFEVLDVKFCNGKISCKHFDTSTGIVIKPLLEAIFDDDIKKYLGKSFDFEKYPFATLNTRYLEQGIFVLVEKNYIINKPLYIKYHYHDCQNLFSNIRNVFILETDSQLKIIEDYVGDKTSTYCNNIVNEFYIGKDAKLQHYKIQNENHNSYHIAMNSVVLKDNAKYKALCIQKDCIFSRNESLVRLQNKGAEAEINGVYCIGKNSVIDNTTNIMHLAPHTYSNQFVKGVVNENGKGIFQGQIHIAKDAQQTEGNQLHRALLLSDEAEIDCKPELEIFADDVKCSHGATCGDLDKEQLFYMQSRGIALEEAKQILIEAYLNEVLEKIEDIDIKNWLISCF